MRDEALIATVLVSVATLAREAATEVTEVTARPMGNAMTFDSGPAAPLRALADKLETGARNLDDEAYALAMAGRSEWWRRRHA